LAAVAPGGSEVGVDVELVRPRRDLARLAARWLPAADAEAVAAAAGREREVTFYAAWTRHEARVKCTGAGLAGPVPGPEVVARRLRIDEGYAAAVASEGTPLIVLRDAFVHG
jgi:4'-phosphopantetheinyl transferase